MGSEWNQAVYRVGKRIENNHRERKRGEVLFVFDFLVDAEDRVKSSVARRLEKYSVFKLFKTQLARRLNKMARQMTPETPVNVVVE